MGCRYFLLVCATISCVYITAVLAQNPGRALPRTRFTCRGRAQGYYADVDTGCQVYHMCDGLGRQFSYSCPNTTLFQQRMLICDHWYMVNCSKSEKDYDANLLIGQRDKPFVTDAEMQELRTPRPDILSVPANENYYDGLKEAESKFPAYPSNNIVGIGNSIDYDEDDDFGKKNNYRPPTSWSTGLGFKYTTKKNKIGNDNPSFNQVSNNLDNIAGAASQDRGSTFKRLPSKRKEIVPSKVIEPPFSPLTTDDLDSDDPIVNFINRFDPDSPKSHKTSMSKTEIIDINKDLPDGQSSAEDEKNTFKDKHFGNNFNFVKGDRKKDEVSSRYNTVNLKADLTDDTLVDTEINNDDITVPDKVLLPPKPEYSEQSGSTAGPPVYYEWKWAVPAFDLEPPKSSNKTEPSREVTQARSVSGTGESPFSHVTRPPPTEIDIIPRNIEYNVSSYTVPDYVFPLDNPHQGYESEDAKTSFMVPIKGKANSYGENPECPECHPAFLVPGTCEPCIVNR